MESKRVLRSHTRSKLPPSQMSSQCSTLDQLEILSTLSSDQPDIVPSKPTKHKYRQRSDSPVESSRLSQAKHALAQLEETHNPDTLIGREK